MLLRNCMARERIRDKIGTTSVVDIGRNSEEASKTAAAHRHSSIRNICHCDGDGYIASMRLAFPCGRGDNFEEIN